MRVVNRNALVPYTARQMYDLVADIARYPDFVPGCCRAELLSSTEQQVEATLEFSKSGITQAFATRNQLHPDSRIDMELLDGPFRSLQGAWHFTSLGDDGCKVALTMEFEFDSKIKDAMFGRYFEDICSRMIDAFVARASDVYASE